MNPSDYLLNKLKNSTSYKLSGVESQFLKTEGIENFVLKALFSKKFRKWKVEEECRARVEGAVKINISQKKPLQIVFPMGGYKLWRLPSSPEADWAEFFNIAYLLEYISPILAAYSPGVDLYYYLHTLLMEKHDNLTTEEIKLYGDSFQKLIDCFSQFFPKNLKLKIWRDADFYSRDEYFKTLEDCYEIAKEEYRNLPEEKRADLIKLSKLNIKWNGRSNWNDLDNEEKNKKITDGAIYEIAVGKLKRVQEAVKASDKILLFTKPSKQFIGIGSTKNSIVKHWTGFGVLEKTSDGFSDRILSPSQFEKSKAMPHEVIKNNLIPLKNFREIWLYNKPFNFLDRT